LKGGHLEEDYVEFFVEDVVVLVAEFYVAHEFGRFFVFVKEVENTYEVNEG
jgi:hypothetical protein